MSNVKVLILSAIYDNRNFRFLFAHAKQEVAKKFPEVGTISVGGFIFLRYLCPALVTPEIYGLVQCKDFLVFFAVVSTQ